MTRDSARGCGPIYAPVREPLIDAARAIDSSYFAGRVGRDKFNQDRRRDWKRGTTLVIGMIGGIDAPGVPHGPVGFERPLGVRCIGRESIAHMTLDLLERAQASLGAGPERRHQGAGGH